MVQLEPTTPAPIITLPDYLAPNLRLLIVGINPGTYSAQTGHYYARPGNLFWWALSNSGLVPHAMGPENDHEVLNYGIGLTDIVKRPTNSSGDLRQSEFDLGALETSKKIEEYRPQVVCFIGLLGATAFIGRQVEPGALSERIGESRLFTIPSTSRRNAHYGKDTLLNYFKDLARFVR
jgi:double-stranded uracil-DNA glycosylase